MAVLIAAPAGAQMRVRSAAELNQALGAARGGETIELAPGDYGPVRVSGRKDRLAGPPAPVVIKSADSARPARLSSIDLRHAQNLTFEGLELRYAFAPGDTVRAKPFSIRDSRMIAIVGSRFVGDVAAGAGEAADGFPTGIGLDVVASANIRIEGNQFSSWHRGAVFAQSVDLVVRGNEVRDLRSDGFNFAQVNNVLIERNRFLAFRTSLATGDHPDMIQFWTNQTKAPSTDIVIRENYIDIGDGPWTQSIFMRNEEVDNGRAGPEMFYRNITIVGNFIRNSHLHGITVGETQGLTITNNTLIQAAASPRVPHVTVPVINVKPTSQNVRIEGNVAARFPELQIGWAFAGNVKIQRNFPRAKDFYNNVFVDALATGAAPPESFQMLPGAFAGETAAGSPYGRFDERPSRPRLVITSAVLAAGRGGEQQVAVSAAYGPAGRLDLTGARAVWTLADGVAKDGLTVSHRFPAGGVHRPSVVVTLRDGTRIEGARWVLSE